MKNLTRNSYVKEIIRFCQILTQQKYDENDDKILKKMISDNLECVSFNASIQSTNEVSKKIQINQLLKLSSAMVRTKYGTKEDRELKCEIAKTLANISQITAREREIRQSNASANDLKKMVACF